MTKSNLLHSITVFILPFLRTALLIVAGIFLVFLPQFRGMNLIDVSKWWVLICIAVNIVTLCVLFIALKREGKTFNDLIHHNPIIKMRLKITLLITGCMFILGIGGLFGFSYLIYGYMPLTNTQPLPIWAAIITLLLFPVTTALAEIPFYLGYCTTQIKRITNNEFLSIFYPLFFYALQHSFMPLIFDWQHITLGFLKFIPLLILLGIWYYKKKDLLPIMIGHGLLDTAISIQILLVSIFPSIYSLLK